MNEQNQPAPAESRSREQETPIVSRSLSPGTVGPRSGDAQAEADQDNPIFKKALEILRQQSSGRIHSESAEESQDAERPTAKQAASVAPVEQINIERSPTTTAEPPQISPVPLSSEPQIANRKSQIGNDSIPARMLNEFVYCQRLFYYEFVERVFVESADTLRGGAIHQRVDSGNGALPKAKRKAEADNPKAVEKAGDVESDNGTSTSPQPSPQSGEGDGEPET
ncbi:MAG: hypothetical protein HY735_23850, partial [Verrucomicrobia bacterium]|nr:hypothetical protein [Verrucomicrobiota bacterium]